MINGRGVTQGTTLEPIESFAGSDPPVLCSTVQKDETADLKDKTPNQSSHSPSSL